MNIAHVVMVYKNPEQIERMINSMNHPNFYFYLHVDLKMNIKDFAFLEKIERVKLIQNRVLCNWGGYSFVEAILSSMDEILNSGKEYSFYNLLSGQDYPIKPVEEIYSFYKKNQGRCFISYSDDPEQKWWKEAIKRTELYHFTDLNFKGKYVVQKIFNKYLRKRSFPLSLTLYGSSDSSWWTLTTECVAYIVDFMKRNVKLQRFMKYTWGSDEFLIATIVMNSPFKNQVVNDNLRCITWTDGVANPRILTQADFDLLKSSPKFFARKFDVNVNEEILDEIDELILHG
ncbi:Core-2/I-Branching enzyme [compost metagenome]